MNINLRLKNIANSKSAIAATLKNIHKRYLKMVKLIKVIPFFTRDDALHITTQ